jgi:MFS transporter, DHA2 family, multidrug resistance protein
LWILDIYSFMLAGFLVTMGTLGDRIGRRRLLLTGPAGRRGAAVHLLVGLGLPARRSVHGAAAGGRAGVAA